MYINKKEFKGREGVLRGGIIQTTCTHDVRPPPKHKSLENVSLMVLKGVVGVSKGWGWGFLSVDI